MRSFEDHFVERKTIGDQKDWLKTAVAFANSAPLDYRPVLFIGVRNQIETPQANLDSLQQTLNRELKKAYPPIIYSPTIVSDGTNQALAVVIFPTEDRPHFSGPAFIRKGSETFEASELQFQQLIAKRNSKVRRILEYLDKPVTVMNIQRGPVYTSESYWPEGSKVLYCDQFCVTLGAAPNQDNRLSFPLEDVTISFDNKLQRLELKIRR